jgi:branched-chain amino acid transport system ATP-binding protein
VSAGLVASDVVVDVGDSRIVDGVSVAVPPGRITGLVGPNGAGKSTLFDALAGVLAVRSGSITLDDVDVTRASADKRSRLGLARTFQHLSVFPSLTVEANLLVGAEHRSDLGLFRSLLRTRRAGRETTPEIVESALVTLGLVHLRSQRAAALPTATLRLVELARALCTKPTVLLLDEPASGLDDAETAHLRDVLSALAGQGLAILLVEHDLALVRDVADDLYAMAQGHVVATGRARDLLGSADLVALVGGTRTRGRSGA